MSTILTLISLAVNNIFYCITKNEIKYIVYFGNERNIQKSVPYALLIKIK